MADPGCHESRKWQSLQTDLMDFLWVTVKGQMPYGTRAPAPAGGSSSHSSKVMLFSAPLPHTTIIYCTFGSHLSYLCPQPCGKQTIIIHLNYCINTEHLKMNHTYLHFSFLACNYIYKAAIRYRSCLFSWHIKSSLTAGVFLFLLKKSSQQDPYLTR